MARMSRRRYDYRGPEYDERFGRYEGAFARRAALAAWIDEGRHGARGYPPPPWSDRGARRQPVPPEIDYADDQDGHASHRMSPWAGWQRRPEYDVDYRRTWDYSRRWWPREMARRHRWE